MAVDDDIDSLEEELEGLDDDDDGGGRAMIMRFLPVMLAVGSLVVLSIVVLVSYGGDEEEEPAVMKLQELAPGTATIKIAPDDGAPVEIEGQENTAYNPMNQGSDGNKVVEITPPPEVPIKPETGGILKVLPPDAPPGEAAAAATEEGAAAEAGATPEAGGAKAENLIAVPEFPAVDPAAATDGGKIPETAAAEVPKKPETMVETAQAGTTIGSPASKILGPAQPRAELGTTAFRTMAGVYRVQVASAKSEGLAEREWKSQVNKFPDVLATLSLTVQRAIVKDRGTFYRVQGGPFPDRSAADSVCRKLKSRGQDCLVVRP